MARTPKAAPPVAQETVSQPENQQPFPHRDDTVAISAPVEEAHLIVAPRVVKVCLTCRYWRQRPNYAHIGECLPTRAGGPSPLVTLDYASCGNWTSIE